MAERLGGVIREAEGYELIVIKSTVLPGTALGVVLPALERSGKRLGQFGLASNPEFLREGHAIEDTLKPDRLVIGTEDTKSRASILSFYRRFYRVMPKTIVTPTANAELIKYASNAYLAAKVTFINEIARLSSKLPGADVTVVAEGMGLDRRIAPGFLEEGLGYGGSCLPKDVSALLKLAEQKGVQLRIAKTAAEGNEDQAQMAIELAELVAGDIREKRVAILGLAFKADSDDMREAVSLRLIPGLVERGAKVVAYDPVSMENARTLLPPTVEFAQTAKECIAGSDCCVVVTEWPESARLKPAVFKKLMRSPSVVDGRRVFQAEEFERAGVRFAAVGLGPAGSRS